MDAFKKWEAVIEAQINSEESGIACLTKEIKARKSLLAEMKKMLTTARKNYAK